MPKKIFIIACEASADLHGAHLVSGIKKLAPDTEFCGVGGIKMREAGVRSFDDMTTISALGLGDVLRNYFKYLAIFNRTIEHIRREKPDVLIVIDSPAFNLRLAKKVSKFVPIVYYISPQLWAWGKRRIHIIKKHVREMLVILPFEKDFYEKEKVAVKFVGHPLLDAIPVLPDAGVLRAKLGIPAGKKAIGLFSGSREKEVKRILPVMLKTAELLQKDLPDTAFFVSRSSNVRPAVYEEILQGTALKVGCPAGTFYELVKAMDFALVASGTATLETSLIGTPFFLLYKASWSTYFLGKRLIKVPYLGLVNLLADDKVVPEFIQQEAHPETIAHEARIFLESPELQAKMREEFRQVREKLGEKGASARAAKEVLAFLG
ncbi:MAG TPA: lipid-A-disaccharide synthase [Candidatus Omnitrophota bacterium]|nr:lipid-A-disaccharide synthase [Candidatus Omnitrophota bacterium]HPS37367.1 lipid-A-disaccharide synthase [Candidatus Omnitrophota bacterium]